MELSISRTNVITFLWMEVITKKVITQFRNNRENGYDIVAGHISDISWSNHSKDILHLEVMISS